MEPLYRESRPILPRNLTYLVAVVLVATLAFMVFSEYVLNTDMPSWMVPVSAVIFVVVIVVLYILRMDVEIYPDKVVIRHAFRTIEIMREEVIEVRHGELTEIRNYGNWNLKGVKHRAYTRIGDDDGVAMKLMGKRVVVFSASEAERAAGLVPIADPEEEGSAKEEAPEVKGGDE